jgi:predicted dehydrogenase
MIVLATPHNLRVQQIQAGARVGKHVFCEKPLALTFTEAVEAVKACEVAKVNLGVGHDKRFWPAMQELREIVLLLEYWVDNRVILKGFLLMKI